MKRLVLVINTMSVFLFIFNMLEPHIIFILHYIYFIISDPDGDDVYY